MDKLVYLAGGGLSLGFVAGLIQLLELTALEFLIGLIYIGVVLTGVGLGAMDGQLLHNVWWSVWFVFGLIVGYGVKRTIN